MSELPLCVWCQLYLGVLSHCFNPKLSTVEEARNVMVFEGGLPPLIALLRSQSLAVQANTNP